MPVYNTMERYLIQSVNSVLNQTYMDYELIIVDDGSCENTAKICESFSQKSEKIKVVHQENKGVSAARNLGLSLARGAYVCFLDADDMLDADYLEKMMGYMTNSNADVMMCAYRQIDEDNIVFYECNCEGKYYAMDKHDAMNYLLYLNYKVDISAIFSAIYKIASFRNIEFPYGVVIGEDVIAKFKIINNANSIYWLDENLMSYRIQQKSAMRSNFKYNYLNTLNELEKMEALCPEFEQGIKARRARICFIYLFMEKEKEEYNDILQKEIIKIRSDLLKDKRLAKKLRIAILSTYFGFKFTRFLYALGKGIK